MTLGPASPPATVPASPDAERTPLLTPQHDRPSLPPPVPVVVDCAGVIIRAELIGTTRNVLLLQGPPGNKLPPLGTPIRMRSGSDTPALNGRVAAHGVAGRFLVSIGDRAIRGSRRLPLNLPGVARSADLPGPVDVRITDLSPSGARVEGIHLRVGTEVDLSFTRPGRRVPITVRGFTVRLIETAEPPTIGIGFCLFQPTG